MGLCKDGKSITCSLHNLVANEFLEKPDNDNYYVVDHIDHDRTSNKLLNLRYATLSQNGFNKAKGTLRQYASLYKGVNKSMGRWRAEVAFQGQKYHLGRFDTEEAAARAYNNKALEIGGEYAYINQI